MSFSNVAPSQGAGGLNLGKFLQIAFTEGMHNQLSEDYRDWEMVQSVRTGEPNGREIRFLLQSSYGPSAVQYRNPNFSASFPASQQISISEHSAVYKELNVTVEIEYNLWNRAMKSPAKYAEPLAMEIQSKTTASKRRLAADWYGDGTGVVGEAASVVDAAAQVEVTLETASSALGHVGFFEFGDLLVSAPQDGSDSTPPTFAASTGFYCWKVKNVIRGRTLAAADKVILEPVTEAGAVLTDMTASNIAANEVFYRYGQPGLVPGVAPSSWKAFDLSNVSDYGSTFTVIAGLESLVANDGRAVHGITMSGITASSSVDAAGAPLDTSLIQQMLSQTKTNVGEGKYSWKKLCMAPEALDSLIEARETDRRFHSMEDSTRGVRYWAYQHGQDTLEAYTSEFCPKSRVYALPEAKGGKKIFEFHGTDFEAVKANDSGEFHLKPGVSGGHERRIVTYLESMGVIVCLHPRAVGRITNFS